MHLENGLGNGQAHPRALGAALLLLPAKILLKDMRHFISADARAAIGYCEHKAAVAFDSGCDCNRLLMRGIARRILQQVLQHALDEGAVHPDWAHAVRNPDFDAVLAQSAAHALHGKLDQLSHVLRARIEAQRLGVETRHLDSLSDEAVKMGTFFFNHGDQIVALGFSHCGLTLQRRGSGTDCGQRSTQIVGDGVEDGGAQALAFARGFKPAGALESGRPLQRYRYEAGDGLIHRAGQRVSGHGQSADIVAHTQT